MDIYNDYFVFRCPYCDNQKNVNYNSVTIGQYDEACYLSGIHILHFSCEHCSSKHFLFIPEKIITIQALAITEIMNRALDTGATIDTHFTSQDVQNFLAGKEKLSNYFSLPFLNARQKLYFDLAKKYLSINEIKNMIANGWILYGSKSEVNDIINTLFTDSKQIKIILERHK